MEKQVKHTENYVGTFTQNAFVAQCQNCHDMNRQIINGKSHVEEYMKEKNLKVSQLPYYSLDILNEKLNQEWYQRKNMEYIPSEKMTCENGYTRVFKSFWVCKECADSDGEGFDGDYEEWSNSGMGMIDTPTGSSEIIHKEILN